MFVYMCVYICLSLCACAYTCFLVCVYVWLCMCVYVSMYACMYLCMCMCVCLCVYLCVSVCVYVYIHVCVHTQWHHWSLNMLQWDQKDVQCTVWPNSFNNFYAFRNIFLESRDNIGLVEITYKSLTPLLFWGLGHSLKDNGDSYHGE